MNIDNRSALPDSDVPHTVRFYDDDTALLAEVSGFIDAAFAAQGAAIVIATPAHCAGMRARMAAPERVVFLDAEATLTRLLVDGWPDEARFRAVIAPLLDAAARNAGGGPVHAFGEMVALLCAGGRYQAAVRLEQLWNVLAAEYRFVLFCAYPWRLFPDAAQAEAFEQVCAEHGRACGHTPSGADHDVKGRSLEQVRLEQRATALEAEVLRHKEQQRHAERELRWQERELADFVENAVEGLHRVGPDGTILWANRAELQMLGYRWEEYVGRHIAEFHVDAETIDGILCTLLSGGALYDQPARLRCKDGSIRHVRIHSNGCFEDDQSGGKLRHTRCFTRDATERHERDAALAQRDAMLLNVPVAAALLMAPDLRFRLANRRFCELVGRRELAGKRFAEALPQLRHSAVETALEQVFESGRPFCAEELPLVLQDADGTPVERFFKLNLEALNDAHGGREGVMAVVVDVTEHVRNRRAIERAHREREQLLVELTAASQAKDEFLAMLGHELRNPLSPIVTALQLMRMRGEDAHARERDIIQRQVEHLVRLVDDLLDVSRVTRGKVELRVERAELAQVLAKAVEMASLLLEQRRHRLEIDVEAGIWWEGDPVRLAQVVSNLLTNAARYTEPGGRVCLRARRVHGDDGDAVEIGVADNGIGMAPALRAQVFDLFFQGKRCVDRAEGGLGIGLALVKNIVELHGGTVEARSEGKGKGSEFLVRLPLRGAGVPATAPAAPAAATGLPLIPRRVLVVDDNVDGALTLGSLLGVLGHTVEVCHDPVAALDAVARLRPEVALLDIGLPVLDGYQLAARIRALPEGQACRLVALTGYGQDADRARSQAAGFARHLVKPISPDEAARVVAGD